MSDRYECPGEGRCHGCISWCDRCGDTLTVCDCERCDRHRCARCNVKLTNKEHEHRDWAGFCTGCVQTFRIEDKERAMIRAVESKADQCAKIFAEDLEEMMRS